MHSHPRSKRQTTRETALDSRRQPRRVRPEALVLALGPSRNSIRASLPHFLVSPPAAATPPTPGAHHGVHSEHILAHILPLSPQPLHLRFAPRSQRRRSRACAQQPPVQGTLLPGMLYPSSTTTPSPIPPNPAPARQATGCDIRRRPTRPNPSSALTHPRDADGVKRLFYCFQATFPSFSRALLVRIRVHNNNPRAQLLPLNSP